MEMGAGGSMTLVREGRNGWVCMPGNPGTPGPDPMCADRVWQAWFGAYKSRSAPEIGEIGTAPTSPDQLASNPTDSESGGPYVMWAGTPYAHLMVPIARG